MSVWKVGQKVFVVITLNRISPCREYRVITKVGRKWISYGEGYDRNRFNAVTLRVDGGKYSSPGEVYISEGAYYAEHEAKFYMRNLAAKIFHIPQTGVQTCDILAAAKLLHIELDAFK